MLPFSALGPIVKGPGSCKHWWHEDDDLRAIRNTCNQCIYLRHEDAYNLSVCPMPYGGGPCPTWPTDEELARESCIFAAALKRLPMRARILKLTAIWQQMLNRLELPLKAPVQYYMVA